ncbi:HNH endonuclease family protein [Streptomyces sp. NPDC002952]|uniref:HNH endonuclease family protein n=1 Tax=Streptomyces sp. NPDC002952 TaxID=3364673 RepID=UPI003681813C
MITLVRAATAAAATLALTLPAPLAHAANTPQRLEPETLPIGLAVDALPLATENRTGYQRTSFKHWTAGDIPADGCNTRNEVLLHEATEAPSVGARCALTGGTWWSYYDDTTVSGASGLDIDHMVPLAEAWDSGASAWTPARREAYANDQGQDASLVAVTARSNRSKADQDPSTWLPPSPDALCRYGAEWTATKLRWQLTIDQAENDALHTIADQCPDTAVTYTPAP